MTIEDKRPSRLIVHFALVVALAFGFLAAFPSEAEAGPVHQPPTSTVCWDGWCQGGERELFEWLVERYCHPYDYGVFYEIYGQANGFTVDYAGTYAYGTTRKYRIYSWVNPYNPSISGVHYEGTVYVRMPGCDAYSIYVA